MPRKTKTGGPRYATRHAVRLPPMTVDGHDLGPPLKPADVCIALRQALQLTDDDILAALAFGAERMEDRPELFAHLLEDERAAAIEDARAATRSRVVAWRRRSREMTWMELCAFLAGIGDLLD